MRLSLRNVDLRKHGFEGESVLCRGQTYKLSGRTLP